jgi:UDP-N-acetylglucosamine 2-epimerase (non-hydrolysing)
MQEESTFLGVPCLTMRDTTERIATVMEGTNTLVGADLRALLRHVEHITQHRYKRGRVPAFWDGQSAQRIVTVLRRALTPALASLASAAPAL